MGRDKKTTETTLINKAISHCVESYEYQPVWRTWRKNRRQNVTASRELEKGDIKADEGSERLLRTRALGQAL